MRARASCSLIAVAGLVGLVGCGSSTKSASDDSAYGSSTPGTTAPTTAVPLTADLTLGLDPGLGFVPREVQDDTEYELTPMKWPKGIALRGPSNLTVRAFVERTEGPEVDDFTYHPDASTGRVTAIVPLSDGTVLSLMINGDEIDVRELSDRLRAASSGINVPDPFGWLMSTLGDGWTLAGDSRDGYAISFASSSIRYSKGTDWLRVVVSQPRPAMQDIALLGLAYGSLDLVEVNGTSVLYSSADLGSGSGPFAIVVHPSTGSVVTIYGAGGPATLAQLALGMKPVTIEELTAQVRP